MFKTQVMLCALLALISGYELSASPTLELSGHPKGEFSVSEDGVVLARRFGLKFIKPGWKGNHDSIIKIADPEIRQDSIRYTATIGSAGGYRVEAKKVSPTSLRCTYDIVLIGKIPIETAFVSILIPAQIAQQRGEFSPAPGVWTRFPLEMVKKQTVFAGSATTFAWKDGLGRNLRVEFPGDVRLNLSDMRQWGRPVFELRIFLTLSKSPATVSFPLTIKTSIDGQATQPFVDRFGQWARVDWPGKVMSEKDLQNDISKEDAFLSQHAPPARDEFGGWEGSREKFGLQATGFFHTRKINGRWWLVDPKGNVFFSLGLPMVYLDTYTIPTGREKLFEWLPPKTAPWDKTWMKLQGNECFSFYKANLIRKYGANWGRSWYENCVKRWTSWGFNTTSAFGGRLRGIPYANGPHIFIDQCAPAIPGTTADIFDPALPSKLDALCKVKLAKLKADPLFVGYFFGNEQMFEKIPEVVPRLSDKYAIKRKLVAFLAERHKTIDSFNRAWNMTAKDFPALAAAKFSATTPKARQDMDAFLALYCDTYGQILRQTIKKHDPNHLLLGFRWTAITAKNRTIVENLGRYMDVISVNYYSRTGINRAFLTNVSKLAGDKPVLITEWSYGTCERGHTGGIVNVTDQKDRGRHYQDYVETASSLPFIVGCHWYEYVDQAITGRYFGGDRAERCNCGLVDITDRPFMDFLEHVTKTNYRIYDVLSGAARPFMSSDKPTRS